MGYWIEQEFEIKMRPYIDEIYPEIISYVNNINRVDVNKSERDKALDIELGIDTEITFTNGSPFTVQEKTRESQWQSSDDFTFELMNTPDENGEFFKLSSHLYFYGYANEMSDGYAKFYIIDVMRLKMALRKFSIETLKSRWLEKNKKHGKATFLAIPFSFLRGFKDVVMVESGNKYSTNKNIKKNLFAIL